MKGGKIILIIGKILKEERLKRNLTIEQLSKMTNISKSEISRIENGKVRKPKGILLYRLCNALYLDYDKVIRERWEILPTFLYGRKKHVNRNK